MGADGPGGDGEGCWSLGREGQAANGMRKTVSQAPSAATRGTRKGWESTRPGSSGPAHRAEAA